MSSRVGLSGLASGVSVLMLDRHYRKDIRMKVNEVKWLENASILMGDHKKEK
jgi:hypothetical protein